MSSTQTDTNNERRMAAPERFFMYSPFSIVTLVARINGNISADMLKTAAAKVQQRHALLRMSTTEDQDHNLWFTSDQVGEIPVEIHQRNSEDDWIRIHGEASRIPFEFNTRPPMRFILVQAPQVCELIILCHHIICDGMSLAYLARDLLVHLGDPERELEVLPVLPPIDLGNLPPDVSQSGLAKLLIKRMNRKWREDPIFFDQQDYEILTRAYWDNYHHQLDSIELSEGETAALVAKCRGEKVTVNSALTAAFCGAQLLVGGEGAYHEKIVVAANLRDRIPHAPGEGMGMYAGGVELKFKYDTRAGFWENTGRFNKLIQPKFTNKNLFSDILNWLYLDPTMFEAIHFKKLGGLVPPDSPRYEKLSGFSRREDVILSLLKRDKLESLDTRYWGTAVTNLGRLDFPSRNGTLELDRLIMQPGGGIPLVNANLVLGAVTCAGKLSLVLEYCPEAVETSTMQKVRDQALGFLIGEKS